MKNKKSTLNRSSKLLIALSILTLACIGVAAAAAWHFSSVQTSTVQAGIVVTMDPVPAAISGQVNDYTGHATNNGQPLSGATINLFVNGTSVATAVSDASGNYAISFPINYPDGTVLQLKTGVLA